MEDEAQEIRAHRHERFRASLANRRMLIVDRWIELRMVRWSRIGSDQLRAWARELADQAAEFGYLSLGDIARELQHRLENAIGDHRPGPELVSGINGGIERVNMQIDQVQLMGPIARPGRAAGRQAAVEVHKLLVADADSADSALIEAVATPRGAEVTMVRSADVLLEQIRKFKPNVLVVDEPLLPQDLDSPGGLGGRFGSTPWILVSRQVDAAKRMRALSAGASACLRKPVDVQELDFALALACPEHMNAALKVLVIADHTEHAERQLMALRDSGLDPVAATDPAAVFRVSGDAAADAVLLDSNDQLQQRDLWLSWLTDTPGFDGLPVVCLNALGHPTVSRHRRTVFLPAAASDLVVALTLRRAVLENQRDAIRVLRCAQMREQIHTCSSDAFMAGLTAALSPEQVEKARQTLLVVEMDAALSLLHQHGMGQLLRAQQHLEDCVLRAMDGHGRCSRRGSSGVFVLLAAPEAAAVDAFLARLQQQLVRLPSDLSAVEAAGVHRAAVLSLTASLGSAAEACRRVEERLRDAHRTDGARFQVIEVRSTEAAKPTLPVDRMYLQVHPMVNIAGAAQNLHEASIHLRDGGGHELSIGALLAEVVAKGMATQLDVWQMNRMVAHFSTVPPEIRGVEIAMRLSAASRESADLVPTVRGIIAKVPPNRGFRLVFEVGESWLFEHNAAAVEMVQALRGLGCGVMLGDFGGTDNSRNLGWASWFDYALLSRRRMNDIAASGEPRAAAEKLVRTAISRGACIVGGRTPTREVQLALTDWGVGLFERPEDRPGA